MLSVLGAYPKQFGKASNFSSINQLGGVLDIFEHLEGLLSEKFERWWELLNEFKLASKFSK